MYTAVNHILLRRFIGLFNEIISTAKVKLRNIDKKLKYRNKE